MIPLDKSMEYRVHSPSVSSSSSSDSESEPEDDASGMSSSSTKSSSKSSSSSNTCELIQIVITSEGLALSEGFKFVSFKRECVNTVINSDQQ